jgi:hypothetical protein
MDFSMLTLLAMLAGLAAVAQADNSKCSAIPNVKYADQTPSDPNMYGKCTNALEKWLIPQSHWCKFGDMGTWPDGPSTKAKQCMKFGRSTIFRGPIHGSSKQHKAACNKILTGSDHRALIAVSTKYLKTYQGGWSQDTGSCGMCMCIRIHGADNKFNKGLQTEVAQKHLGLTFMGEVGDRCSECEDDHIDILQERPFSWAPFDPKRGHDNYHAPYVNAKSGLRGFRDPAAMRSTGISPESVGAWTTDWQFVPCSYTHDQCAALMKDMGYSNVWTPSWTEGLDSWSLRPVASLRTANPRLTQEPHSGRKLMGQH